MTHAVLGVLATNALFLTAGCGVLFALRGFSTWSELVRLAGLAYLLGLSVVGLGATLVLIAGGGLGLAVVLALPLSLTAAGIAAGLALGRPRPRRLSGRGRIGGPAALGGVLAAALALVSLEAFYRAARLQGLTAWDAWAFWVQKSKAIYYFGGLDPQLFRTLAGPSYPLLVPAVQAMDFRLIGSADATALALQYWLFLAAFIAAAAGLLRPRVPLAVLWPFLALATLMPELDKRMLGPQADWPLDILFAIAALCLGRWLLSREPWLLASAAILLAAMMATKREGALLAACLIAGGAAATAREWRRFWPWLAGAIVLAYAVNLPWRFWWTSRGLPSENPDGGLGRLSASASRVLPAFRVVLELLFSYDLWLLAVPLAVGAAALVLSRREYRLPVLYLVTCGLGVVGFTWILWSIPTLPLDTSQRTPIPRAVGSLVLLSIVFAPLLLSRVIGRVSEPAVD